LLQHELALERGTRFRLAWLWWQAASLFGDGAVQGGGAEGSLTQLLGRMVGGNLELAAVFQQLDEPLLDELARIFAESFLDFLLDRATRAAVLIAEDLEESFGRFEPGFAFRVEIVGKDAVAARVADAHHFSRQHRHALECARPRRAGQGRSFFLPPPWR